LFAGRACAKKIAATSFWPALLAQVGPQDKPKNRLLPPDPRMVAVSGTRRMGEFRESAMASGTVKFFNNQKGYGFITPADGSNDVFVHVSAVEKSGMTSLSEGQRVTFDVVTERGKLAASNLQAA
jgi:CspA family cold shock protein